jgi:hypothetical protein
LKLPFGTSKKGARIVGRLPVRSSLHLHCIFTASSQRRHGLLTIAPNTTPRSYLMHRFIIALTLVLFVSTIGYAQFPKPVKEHEVLKHEVGNWAGGVKFYAQGPDADPIESKGNEVIEMVGGFWAVGKYKGSLLGQPFSGQSTLGYDTNKKKYVGFWVDSFTSSLMEMEGTYDADKKTMTILTKGVEPNGEPNKGKMIVVYGKDSKKMTMFATHEKTDIKVMEISYTRKK